MKATNILSIEFYFLLTVVECRIKPVFGFYCVEVTYDARTTDANEAFFHWNPENLGLGRQIGQINSGAFGVFSTKLSAPILVQWVPCPCFLLVNQYFHKKLSLYIHIPNIYLGFEFEFGPQMIPNCWRPVWKSVKVKSRIKSAQLCLYWIDSK